MCTWIIPFGYHKKKSKKPHNVTWILSSVNSHVCCEFPTIEMFSIVIY